MDKYIIKYTKNEGTYSRLMFNDTLIKEWKKKPSEPMKTMMCNIIIHALNLTKKAVIKDLYGMQSGFSKFTLLEAYTYNAYPNTLRHLTTHLSEQVRLNRKNNILRYIYHIPKKLVEDIETMEHL